MTRPAAILAAAGSGDRAGSSDAPKQFRPVAGRPLFMWALDALLPVADEIVIAVPSSWLSRAEALIGPGVGATFTTGGETRQASVASALQRVSSETVVVHDAARPLADPDLTRRVVAALAGADAVIPAVAVDETLKEVDAGAVSRTVDRSRLWRAQTPAAFRTAVLRDAHRRAEREGVVGTDEAQLVENAGGRVVVVDGDARNIKVTYPEDFELAEALIRAR